MLDEIRNIIEASRNQIRCAVNSAMVLAYWQIGRRVVEHEQQGGRRAAYGQQLLKGLSEKLTAEFGKGFDISNLRNMRRFYQTFPIQDAVRPELSWTHYRKLLSVDNPKARNWYLTEAIEQNWSARALERQISTLYYERLLSSIDRTPVEIEAHTLTSPLRDNPTIGLVLCSQKGEALVKYSVLTDSQQMFAAKYLPYLPTEEELKGERERNIIESKIEEARGIYKPEEQRRQETLTTPESAAAGRTAATDKVFEWMRS